MSINNFTKVAIIGGKLVVSAETLDAFGGGPEKIGPGADVLVTVISVENEGKRCDLTPIRPESTPWSAESEDDSHGFVDHEHVYVVGAVTSSAPPFVWGKEFCVGAPHLTP